MLTALKNNTGLCRKFSEDCPSTSSCKREEISQSLYKLAIPKNEALSWICEHDKKFFKSHEIKEQF